MFVIVIKQNLIKWDEKILKIITCIKLIDEKILFCKKQIKKEEDYDGYNYM
jgi:hypothetical protein